MNESNLGRGQRLQQIRQQYKITLRELEAASGYDDAYWCMLEHGKRAWSDHLEKVFTKSVDLIMSKRSQLLSAA